MSGPGEQVRLGFQDGQVTWNGEPITQEEFVKRVSSGDPFTLSIPLRGVGVHGTVGGDDGEHPGAAGAPSNTRDS
jgi:hypothetical protein